MDVFDETMDIFKRLAHLKDDPEAFERERQKILNEFHEAQGIHAQKCRGQQFRIDTELAGEKDPTQRLNKAVEMFWSGVDRFGDALNEPSSISTDKGLGSAKIVQLKRDKES